VAVVAARAVAAYSPHGRARAKTVIFSTHVMSEMEKLCDTIAIIHHGRIMAEGSLAQLRDQFACQGLEDIFVRVVEEAP
jgi:sodium transport system ATP-binding protein